MEKRLQRALTAEAPAWLQASLLGLLASAVVFAVALLAVTTVDAIFAYRVPDWANLYLPASMAVTAALVLVPRLTKRVEVLEQYAQEVAVHRGEAVEVVRRRVWASRGPAVGVLGLSPLIASLLFIVPTALFWMTNAATDFVWTDDGLARSVPIPMLALTLGLYALVALLVWRARHSTRIAALLAEAARDPARQNLLVAQAVEMTGGEYVRSKAFWIGVAALATFGWASAFGDLVDILELPFAWRLGLTLAAGSALAYFATRLARRSGAPREIWLGIAAWVIGSALLELAVYFTLLDSFIAPLAEEGLEPAWPYPPIDYLKTVGWGVAAYLPMIALSWLAARQAPLSTSS